jgi:5-hydroxyisourate hydrolase-like protein (transthyretin family)
MHRTAINERDLLACRATDAATRHHVPPLLSSFAYTTYRGS